MSAEVKFVRPTAALIKVIADEMRQADVAEILASNNQTPIEALMQGWDISDYSAVVMVNNVPCVMLGLVIRDILSGTGTPWLLGTDNALKHKREFVRQVPGIIDQMLSICPILSNCVHVDNKVSINWLRRIGFTFDEPLPYGYAGKLFHKFYIERIE